jgi:hypothetical protein
MATTGQQLQQVYELIQVGEKQHAANLLTVMLATDPDNADALWLLAASASDPATVRRALIRLLQLRPDDHRARHMLDSLNVREVRAASRLASHEMRTARPTYSPLDAPPMVLEERRPRLSPRGSTSATRDRQRSPLFVAALLGAVAFGLTGCAILVLAVLTGLQLVGQTVEQIRPSLSMIAPASAQEPSSFDLGALTSLNSISYFQFREGRLTSPNDQHTYTFTASTGHYVLVEVSAVDLTLDPAVALYGPDGTYIIGSTDIAHDDLNARLSLTLPRDGRYTVLVTAQNTQGSYRLTLRH